jgi:hypothetical protein
MDFEVPSSFSYRWCTDYRSDDSARSKERFERRILRRSRTAVAFEDLWSTVTGWGWRRTMVALRPPNRWHADSFGNIREASIDYRVDLLPGGRTGFDLYMKRRPTRIFAKQPTRASLEKELLTMWENYGRAMVRDLWRAKSSRRSS